MAKGVKKIKVGQFLKMLFIKNNLSTEEVAEKIGKTRANLSGIINRNRMTLATLVEVMEACEEPLVLLLSSGEAIEIEINENKSKDD